MADARFWDASGARTVYNLAGVATMRCACGLLLSAPRRFQPMLISSPQPINAHSHPPPAQPVPTPPSPLLTRAHFNGLPPNRQPPTPSAAFTARILSRSVRLPLL